MRLIFIFLSLSAGCFTSCVKEKEEPEKIENYITVNDKIPSFTVKDAAGRKFHSAEFENHVGLLVFFVSTCSDCARELPKIDTVWTKLKDHPGFRLAAVSRSENADAVNTFWNKQQFTMPFYLDPDKTVFSLFANNTIPRVYLINPEGIVTWMAIEELPLTSGQLLEKIETLLNK